MQVYLFFAQSNSFCPVCVCWGGGGRGGIDGLTELFVAQMMPSVEFRIQGIFGVYFCMVGWSISLLLLAVADPGFPRGKGANSSGGGEPTYDFDKFSQKLHEIERIWTRGGGGGASLAP